MADIILQVENLKKDFGSHQVLKDISFSVNKGDVIATLYASDKKRLQAGAELFAKAVKLSAKKPKPYKLIEEIIK